VKTCKSFGMMVARDGVERFGVPSFQQLADSTKDRKDVEDTKDNVRSSDKRRSAGYTS